MKATTSARRRQQEIAALRTASAVATKDDSLVLLDAERAGHGAAELARRVKAAVPDAALAVCRRAADAVIDRRNGQSPHAGVLPRGAAASKYRTMDGGLIRMGMESGLVRRWTPRRRIGSVPASLADRLAAHRVRKVEAAVDQVGFRRAAQGSTIAVRLDDAREPGISSRTTEGWIDYKRQGHRRGITGQTIAVTVPVRWGSRVAARGLAIVDGLLTLDARPVAGSPDGIELFHATWARQGKGLAITSESGVIARHIASGATYHSPHDDTKRAVAGLRRKLAAQAIPADVRSERARASAAKRAERQATQLARLVDRVARFDLGEIGHVEVRREDSLRAGNCVPGTDEFIDRFFPDRDRDATATIGEIVARVGRLDPAMLRGADLTLARQLAAAALVAVRRDRNARRLVLA